MAMTDLEITRLCADAMGITAALHPIRGTVMRWWYMDGNVEKEYNPLHDDARSMALVKKLRLIIGPVSDSHWNVVIQWQDKNNSYAYCHSDLNRAICECVAKMQQAKK